MYGVERTGVRFVLSNAADPSRADEYSAWYDTYGAGITHPGFLANAFRFENPGAAGNDDDPRSALVVPALRASYALIGSLETPGAHGALTGAYIVLTDGADEASRERWAAAVLETGLFYAASRFRIIEGSPDPPDWLEVFETDQQDPLTAYARSLEALAPRLPAAEIRQRNSGSFRLVSVYPPGP